MSKRLDAALAPGKKQKALIAFVTAGDPLFGDAAATAFALAQAGADVIEWGMPFSDPMADGPVIQRANARAIGKGATLKKLFADLKRLRKKSAVPVVLMGYTQSVLHYGAEKFARDLAAAGGDGVLLVDLPPEEAAEYAEHFKRYNLQQIFLVAPTSEPARMAQIAPHASGYLYYVSMTGVTGAALKGFAEAAAQVKRLRAHSQLPIVVGFGIKDAKTAARVGRFCDGVVVGSALIESGEKAASPAAARKQAAALIARLKRAL